MSEGIPKDLMPGLDKLKQAFRLFWQVEASAGRCDALDGAEYRRLQEQWLKELCPALVWLWIRERANAPPPP